MHYPVLVFIFKPPENEALVFEPWIIFPGDVFISLWFFSPQTHPNHSIKKEIKKRERKLSSGEISCLFCLHAPQPAQIKPCASLISQRTINNKNKDKRENVQKPTWPKQYGTELKQLQIAWTRIFLSAILENQKIKHPNLTSRKIM